MNVLVDTPIWSSAFRRNRQTDTERRNVVELKELIHESRVVMIGPVRQELLSGISDEEKFVLLKERLRAFEDLSIRQADYEIAAEFFNSCRSKGIQGSRIDFLICAVAANNKFSIFTTDNDFRNYATVIDLLLHKVREESATEDETR